MTDPIQTIDNQLKETYECARRDRAGTRLNILASTIHQAREQARTLDGLVRTRDLVILREHLRTAEILVGRSKMEVSHAG